MPLSHKHIPLPCSLRDKVRQEFAPPSAAPGRDPLSRETLIAFLARSKDTDSSPLATIKRRAAKENRAAELRPEDQAALAWVCEAFDEWEDQYPLEQPLKDHIRRLLPMAVAMALKEESFYTPGAHALHRLLDALQNGAVGWQMRLDRAGQMLEQRVQRAVEKALEWFNNDRLDIGAITQELLSANERDVARAQRMVQRLAETEEARFKTLAARRDAALDINQGFERYELPAAIGEFLKGPWYDSAQLVLVKYGEGSREWEEMRRATLHLMESVQAREDDDDAGRDRQEQILRYLPGELRRWLISLEHDSDATDSAIGLVEYAHLRIQHGQKLQVVKIPAIPTAQDSSEHNAGNDEMLNNGDWYRFEDEEGELRAQLVLQLENGQHLLFANFVGLKALDLSRRVFKQRISDGFSVPLPNRESFSVSLATAAGISDEDRLRQLTDPGYRSADPMTRTPEEPQQRKDPVASSSAPPSVPPSPAPSQSVGSPTPSSGASTGMSQASSNPESDRGSIPDVDSRATEQRSGAHTNPDNSDNFDPVLTPPEGAEHALTLDLDEPDPQPPAEPVAGEPPAREHPRTPATADTPQQSYANATPEPAATPVSPPPPAYQAPAAPTPAPTPAPSPSTPAEPAPAPPPPPPAESTSAPPAPPADPAPARAPAPPAATEPSGVASPEREVDVPMGAWLGFHDGETPIMAKLAVFDPRRESYIFVNRKGIAMRELSRSELRALMDKGLVDILETRSYFRDEVERAREEGQ